MKLHPTVILIGKNLLVSTLAYAVVTSFFYLILGMAPSIVGAIFTIGFVTASMSFLDLIRQ